MRRLVDVVLTLILVTLGLCVWLALVTFAAETWLAI